ncbi:TetR family transcriptional regulator C-terminal domain-containing protein [Denitrobaculum tricleocarpae]|uniref:TetR family transcriptional regulator n=1 Tax=Denitrobaculum tricleocarpae TaxID=2591009 RepID=A0A545TYF0_9PROT|nr:TetR family transcriptional regulator C-terminal domain-containing protein [Denitrobaculum tricleocarpae]TQV82239.1 TetR family transcriptional regulator [Denitrobaculum tricleocarpae]
MPRRSFQHAPEGVRRQDLINATLDCIAEDSLQGATVRQIALRAGVTAGLIRYYFPGKDELIHAAYRETMNRMTGQAKALSDDYAHREKATPRQHLEFFVKTSLSPPVVDARTLSLWASFVSLIHVDPEMAEIHKESYLAFRNEVERLIAAVFADEGRPVPKAELARSAIAINAIIDGLWLEGCLAGDIFGENDLVAIGIKAVNAVLKPREENPL